MRAILAAVLLVAATLTAAAYLQSGIHAPTVRVAEVEDFDAKSPCNPAVEPWRIVVGAQETLFYAENCGHLFITSEGPLLVAEPGKVTVNVKKLCTQFKDECSRLGISWDERLDGALQIQGGG